MPTNYTSPNATEERFWKHLSTPMTLNPIKYIPNLKGERAHRAKLTEQQVYEIRNRCTQGEKQAAIAADYDVSRTLVSAIAVRRAWPHLP